MVRCTRIRLVRRVLAGMDATSRTASPFLARAAHHRIVILHAHLGVAAATLSLEIRVGSNGGDEVRSRER